LNDLRAAAIDLVPALAHKPVVNQWAGLRPGTKEGIPYIGECGGMRGLFVNAGQFRNGIVMGLGSALLAAQLISGEPPRFDPSPYQPL
jgi:glycine oxidase